MPSGASSGRNEGVGRAIRTRPGKSRSQAASEAVIENSSSRMDRPGRLLAELAGAAGTPGPRQHVGETAHEVVERVTAGFVLLHEVHVEEVFEDVLRVPDPEVEQCRRRVDVEVGARMLAQQAERLAVVGVQALVRKTQGDLHAALMRR